MLKKNRISPYIYNIIILSAIIGLAILAYWGIHNHQFLNFDDDMYVLTNYHIYTGITFENIKWAFSFDSESYWHPMTWLSLMLDIQIFGLKAGPMLVGNLIFHIFNAILLFLILLKITGSRLKAAIVALLFAIHPSNVESVAWLVERKAVLSAFFFMMSVYLFMFYVKSKNIWIYVLTAFVYVMGIMAKPIIIIFPLVLLILDYWPLNRFNARDLDIIKMDIRIGQKVGLLLTSNSARLIYEKIPFCLISCISVALSMFAVHQHKIAINYQQVPLYLRIKNYFVSIVQYLYNAIWPVEMSIFHPFPENISLLYFLPALILFIVLTIFAVLLRRKSPWILFGWLWFLITLLPAGGFIQAGLWPAFAHRFMYLPLIGLFIIVVWEADVRLHGKYSTFLKIVLCFFVMVYFVMITRLQNTYFSNSYSLFYRALQVDKDNPIALNNIGVALSNLGKEDEAITYFKQGMELYPKKAGYYLNYAICMVAKGNDQQAIQYLMKSIELDQRMHAAFLNLGLIQSRRGFHDEAIALVKKATEIKPGNLSILNNLGNVLVKKGNYAEAIDHFRYIVKRDPLNVEYRMNLALAYQNSGALDDAMKEYLYLDRRLKKNKGYIYYSMAGIYSMQNKFKECKNYLELAHKNGFDVGKIIGKDNRFIKFRETQIFDEFIQ